MGCLKLEHCFFEKTAQRKIVRGKKNTQWFISVDPLQFDYPELTPFQYCANNPIKYIDPDGRDWKTPEDQTKANQLISQATTIRDTKQLSLNELSNVEKPKKWQIEKKEELRQEIGYLNEGIANLTEMSNDKDQTYHFKEISSGTFSIGEGGVRKMNDGVMNIEYTNNAMAWHESVHIGDYRKDPSGWSFTKEGYLGTNDQKLFNQSETKAYRSQYSFDNKSLMYQNGALVTKLSDVRTWMQFHGYDKK